MQAFLDLKRKESSQLWISNRKQDGEIGLPTATLKNRSKKKWTIFRGILGRLMASACHLGSPVCANRRDTVSLAEESLCISFSSSCDLLFASQISKLVFAYSLSFYTTRQCSAPSKHIIENTKTNLPSHNFPFAYWDAKLQWDPGFQGEGRDLSTQLTWKTTHLVHYCM